MSLLSTLSSEIADLRQTLRQQILTVEPATFEPLALAVFRYQAIYNPVYRNFLSHLNIRPERITDLRRVPFMPICFFKNHTVLTGFDTNRDSLVDALTFVSSGTTSRNTGLDQPSQHVVADPELYDAVSTRIFSQAYGSLDNLHVLALLPSYLERNNSSLVYMVQRFMDQTGSAHSGFFLNNHDELTAKLHQLCEGPGQPGETKSRVLLVGVTFGLLDWAESDRDLTFVGQNPNLIVMETGGMKGRRKELLRQEVHEILTQRLGIQTVHSEYGMTELLSQAYSMGEGIFQPSPTLRVFLRDINDPFYIYPANSNAVGERRAGGINVVDLANLDSCSFVETQDLGQYVGDNGQFQVIGRFDNSDVRGCNLMVQ